MALHTYIIGTENVGLTTHRESADSNLLKMKAKSVEHVLQTLKEDYDWGEYEKGGTFLDKWYFPKDQVIVCVDVLSNLDEL